MACYGKSAGEGGGRRWTPHQWRKIPPRETEPGSRAFTAHRETDFGRQRRRAPIRFRTVFISRRDRERAITPAPYRGKSRVFRGDGELGVSAGLRGGAGRTRTGNQTVISPRIEDGRRKDWHSAANRAVVSSSWGNCLSGILSRRLRCRSGAAVVTARGVAPQRRRIPTMSATRLTETQWSVLSAASRRDDHCAMLPPRLRGGAAESRQETDRSRPRRSGACPRRSAGVAR